MKKTRPLSRWILAGFLMLGFTDLQAQFRQLPLKHVPKKDLNGTENLKVQAPLLTLPFWEDFSAGVLDSLKWESRGVGVSNSMAVDPPSIGSAYLDGVDQGGNPYAGSLLANGEGDQLQSLVFDLSSLTAADSVYLSFFWQAGGKGEMPDENDKLELSFLNASGSWVPVWEAFGGAPETQAFVQEMVVLGQEFLHEGFRFRFLSTGRISGPFDTWLLDYIYLDRGRNIHDVYFEDRALTKFPNSLFGKYAAIPLFEFTKAKEEFLTSVRSQFKNLSNRFRAMEYSVELRNRETGALLKTVHGNTPFNPVPQAQERRDFGSVALKDLDFDMEEEFDLETLLYLTTGDNFQVDRIRGADTLYFPQIDYRVNDTVRFVLPVRDFFAYDNGAVDYAAGINQRSGMLALKYVLEQEAYLKGVSINFTNRSQSGSAVDLMVWDNLDSPPLYSKEVIIPEKSSLEEFAYFPLDTNIVLSDTLYIGFAQFTNDFIHVGLDKSNDSGAEIYFNVRGAWEQNQEVKGSLMMRPHFSMSPVFEEPAEEEVAGIRVYPNPVTETLYLEGNVRDVQVFDAYGRQINIPVNGYERGKILNFVGKDKGVYVVRAWAGEKPNSIRILVK